MENRIDERESRKERKMRETLKSLQTLFPGNVHGFLVDLCKPTQRRFDTAFTVILGKNIDAIVVETEKCAHECIRYIRDQRAGHFTFIPLDTIEPKYPDTKVVMKGARYASDAVSFDSKFEKAIMYAVGSCVLTDSLSVSRTMIYGQRQSFKCVAVDGSVIHKTGNITGGVGEHSNGKRWEEREVVVLKEEKGLLSAQIEGFLKEIHDLNCENESSSRLAEFQMQLSRLDDEKRELYLKIEAKRVECQYTSELISQIRAEIQVISRPIEGLTGQIRKTEAVIIECERNVFADFCREIGVTDIREFKEGSLSATQGQAQKMMEYVTSKAKLENALQFEKRRLEETIQKAAKNEETIAVLDLQLNESRMKLAELEETICKFDADTAGMTRSLDTERKKLAEHSKIISNIKRDCNNFNNTFDAHSKMRMQKEAEIEKLSDLKMAMLRRCKLEQVPVVLEDGTLLADLSLDELNVFLV